MPDPRIERAILDFQGLAESLAWQYISKLHPSADRDEILATALEALVQCGHRWMSYCQSHGYDPWDREDPGKPDGHFVAYVLRSVRGRLLDWARHEDHLTRSQRAKVKQIRAAEAAGARTEDKLAAATGLSRDQIRAARAAEAARPMSLDWHTKTYGDGSASLADDGADADVESQAVVSGIMAAFVAEFGQLLLEVQVLLALVYHRGVTLEVAAKELRLEPDEARRLHDAGVLAVHAALVRAVA